MRILDPNCQSELVQDANVQQQVSPERVSELHPQGKKLGEPGVDMLTPNGGRWPIFLQQPICVSLDATKDLTVQQN